MKDAAKEFLSPHVLACLILLKKSAQNNTEQNLSRLNLHNVPINLTS